MARESSLGNVQSKDMARKCPDCGSTEISTKEEEYFCTKCGYVFE